MQGWTIVDMNLKGKQSALRMSWDSPSKIKTLHIADSIKKFISLCGLSHIKEDVFLSSGSVWRPRLKPGLWFLRNPFFHEAKVKSIEDIITTAQGCEQQKFFFKYLLKAKLSPKSNQGFICDWIWVKPLCKSIITTKEALLRITVVSVVGKLIFQWGAGAFLR